MKAERSERPPIYTGNLVSDESALAVRIVRCAEMGQIVAIDKDKTLAHYQGLVAELAEQRRDGNA